MTARDHIIVEDLLLRCFIGAQDWEREKKQDVLINLRLDTDITAAANSDNIADALNYRTITKAIITHVEESSYFTVEALATAIARICVIDHGAARVKVRVEKPGALRFAKSVGVEIEREAADFA
jgi:D-erythro-7,8-dihydroneopterin triphosphate epimerase